jgi:hypothetical protein
VASDNLLVRLTSRDITAASLPFIGRWRRPTLFRLVFTTKQQGRLTGPDQKYNTVFTSLQSLLSSGYGYAFV